VRTAGTYLIELLTAYGVETVFGIPGVHTIELYRGLAASPIRHITPRHEQGAGFMADGYARAGGKPGVCFVITGPGLTNIATAMAQAYADSIPMLVISSVNASATLGGGTGQLHELPDQSALAAQVTAFSRTVRDASELPALLARAFAVFESARPLPVHLELPLDVLGASAEGLPIPQRAAPAARQMPAPADLDRAAALLGAARFPLILAGGGARHAAPALRQLAERLDAPLVMSVNGRGLVPPDHPLGISFSASLPAIRALIAAADVVLAIGTELGQTDYDMYAEGGFAIPGTLIRLDIDAGQLSRNWPAEVALLGDAAAGCAGLLARLPPEPAERQGAARAANARETARRALSPGMARDIALLDVARDAVPDALLVGDSTRLVYAGNLGFAATAPSRWFNAATGYGALGYGLPAAIGAGLARPGQTVLCLCGDGGLQFTLAELGTAIEAGVPLILLLLNNYGYGEIKSAMLAAGATPVGVDLHTPDFQALARAYGWSAELLKRAQDLPARLRAAAAGTRPILIEMREGEPPEIIRHDVGSQIAGSS
jgi:acetolactate synthase I/II/III large subunit